MRAGIVVSIATSGDLIQWHPHGHLLITDGAFSDKGTFHPVESWDAEAVMKLFRERLLARLIECHAISADLARKLLAGRHPGFSAHVGDAIPFEDKKAIEDACYLVRAPLSLKKLVYLDGQKAVLYRSKMSWARLIAKVYQADPLLCRKCGGPLKMVLTDELSITRILDHLGLSTPRQDKPPPTREVVQVPVDDEGRETGAYREPMWS